MRFSFYMDQLKLEVYRKIPKIQTPEQIAEITLNFYHRIQHPEDVDRMANSVDPDQTVLLGAV